MQLIPAQTAPDTVDTAAAAVDTLTLSERLRADSTLQVITDADQWGQMLDRLKMSLLDPNVWWGVLGVALRVVLIIGLAWLVMALLAKGMDRWTRRFDALPAVHPRRQRAYTLSHLTGSAARYVIWPLALIMVLGVLGYELGPLIATAGIAGLAIGFGAQTLVKDVISGIFLLVDDSLHVGDLVTIGTDSGTVEFVGIRLIKVRKYNGELLMVPAGDLRIFGNRSIGFARVMVNVGLAYEQDTDTILPIMKRIANEWAATQKEILLEPEPDVQAIMDFLDSAVMARIVVQVIPGEQFAAERELRVLLKREFDRLGIEFPFPRQLEYAREESSVPPRIVQDSAPPEPSTHSAGSD